MENGAFVQKSKCSIFNNIFKHMIFQRRQKALLWSKGLRGKYGTIFDIISILWSFQNSKLFENGVDPDQLI